MKMKKLVTIMVVLAIATMANAVTLELSLNGQITPGVAEITISPSNTFVIDIWDSQGYEVGQDLYVIAMTNNTLGTISGSGAVILPNHFDTTMLGADAELAELGFVGQSGAYMFVGNYGTSGTWGPGKVIDNLVFHCEAIGDTSVTLLTSQDGATFTPVDSITVHQIPEPMTMALLGLGGLFLRRKMA